MPNLTLKDGSWQVPFTRGCQAFSSGAQPIQANRAPSPNRTFMTTMATQRKTDIQPSEMRSSVMANDVLLHDWLVMASVIEHNPKVAKVLSVSTWMGFFFWAAARSKIMVIIMTLPSNETLKEPLKRVVSDIIM